MGDSGEECRLGGKTWSGGLALPFCQIGDFAEPLILSGIVEKLLICT